jgi:hypothetical protein
MDEHRTGRARCVVYGTTLRDSPSESYMRTEAEEDG